MGADEQQQPDHSNPRAETAAALALLSARIDALEQELARIGAQAQPQAVAQSPAELPIPPSQPSPPPSPAAPPRASLEDRIGSQLFSRIGIAALLIATAFFLKWAIDNQWIGPLGRVLAGLFLGAAVILWSERFRRRGFPAFSYSLKAIGSGALYLSLWAAFQLYHLLPAAVTLAVMLLVTAWNALMAWSQNSEVLAAYALAGAVATPLLLSTGGNHEVFLFTYLLLLDLATVVLIRLKPWPRLLLGAFPATVAYFIAWYVNWYGSPSPTQPLAATAIFVALFFLAFVLPSLRTPSPAEPAYNPIPEVFLPLANAAFAALAMYSVLQDAGYHDLLPWAALLFAAIYLALTRLRQAPVTSHIHLALAIVFLTIAVPLKATGHWITIGWLTEGAALLWVAARLTPQNPKELQIRVPHLRRSLIAAKMGLRAGDPLSSPGPNPSTVPAETSPASTLRRLATFALSLGFLGLLLQPLWLYPIPQTAFLNSRFATALFSIAVFAVTTVLALRIHHPEDPAWPTLAAASTLAFNLTAILAVVRELETAFSNPTANPDAALQKALSLSAFLMLYGALLLAVGFWRRSAFVRWQALVLLVFTIGKTFLYDLRNLSQGYRVLSFFGLGALLMAVSFAYQKDWLALRVPRNPAREEGPGQ